MVVPERYRLAAGKREWKFSLETSDESEARLRHAEKLAEIRRYMAELDTQDAASVGDRADAIVTWGMTAPARSNIVQQASIGLNFDMARGLDNVTYAMPKALSFRVRLGRGGKHAAAAQRQRFSAIDPDAEDDTPEFAPDMPPEAGSAFQTLDHRKLASAQIEAFEGQPNYQRGGVPRGCAGSARRTRLEGCRIRGATGCQCCGMDLATREALFAAIPSKCCDNWQNTASRTGPKMPTSCSIPW